MVAEGNPEDVIGRVAGRIWRKQVTRDELAEGEAHWHLVSQRLIAGKPVVFVYAETAPSAGFAPVDADLEDAYFFHTRSPLG